METRKLCWVPSLDKLEEAVVLEEWEPYYIDYYTSHYFNCAKQIVEAYDQDICKMTTDPNCGRIVVFKDDVNRQGSLVERAINPVYSKHIKKLDYLLSQVYYLKMLERMDYYNYCKQKKDYERIFLLDDYKGLQMISDLNDPIQKQNLELIRHIIYQRMSRRENYYEMIRILLNLKPKEWKYDIHLPSLKDYISYSKVEEVDLLAKQKQITR